MYDVRTVNRSITKPIGEVVRVVVQSTIYPGESLQYKLKSPLKEKKELSSVQDPGYPSQILRQQCLRCQRTQLLSW